ncbi:proliferation-associated protein 2G4-like [Halichondria panicea]|uniref:proliferation-associated protein 2G4-like n=1 Tax=Halichondria panicea TaxID=6063 RepID=UPI00312BB372
MAEKGDSSDEEPTIAEDVVVTKYKMAGDMSNRVLAQVLEACVEGAVITDLCEMGDKLVLEETKKVYKKEKNMKKGIAFPTCVSVDNCVCHFSPLKSDAPVRLKKGDLVKIELGVHVDGFIATMGHTLVVGSSKENKVTGRQADVMQAAYLAGEIAHRMVVPGGESIAVANAIQKVATSFNCNAVEGIICHRLRKNCYDNEKNIILNPPPEQLKRDVKSCEFELYEAYAIDILMSTGEGKTRQADSRTTIFRKTDEVYKLKMKNSRAFYSEVCAKFTSMPFSLRACEEEAKARMGLVECVNHNLVEPYDVIYEKDGEYVSQIKFTLLLMPNGPQRITSGSYDPEVVSSELKLEDPELNALLTSSTSRKNKKKKKKAGKTADTEATDTPTTET